MRGPRREPVRRAAARGVRRAVRAVLQHAAVQRRELGGREPGLRARRRELQRRGVHV